MSRYQYLSIVTLLGIFCPCASILAQKTIVHGIVLDENEKPMPFVNVAFKHSTVGTITDIKEELRNVNALKINYSTLTGDVMDNVK